MFTVGCSHSALCCQSIKKQLIFRVVWEFQCHFQQVIGPVEKCCCRTLPSPSHKRLRDNPYHPGHLQNGDVQNQSATLFWLYEPLLHSTVHQKEYQVSSEYFHKHSWISQHPPLFLCSCILTPSNTSNDSNALPGEIGISSNLIPRLPWESSIVEYNRLVNLLVIKKGVLSWDLWRMKDPSELTTCFCSDVFVQLFPSWQLMEQNKTSYLEPDPKIMITYQRLKSAFWTKNCFSFLSSLYVDVTTKVRTYLWVYQAAIDHYLHLPNFTLSQIKWQNHTKHTASSQRFSNKIPLTAVYPNATPGRIDTFP